LVLLSPLSSFVKAAVVWARAGPAVAAAAGAWARAALEELCLLFALEAALDGLLCRLVPIFLLLV